MKHLFLSLTLALLAACTGGKQRGGEPVQGGATEPSEQAAVPAELSMPAIPESLTTPEDRAAYLALHFWDKLDFADHTLSLDTAFMEQNFANYLSVFPIIPQEADKDAAVEALLRRATADAEATDFLLEVVDKYLRDPNSPMRDEALLILFYNRILDMSAIAAWQRERTAALLANALKNRPGSRPADFAFVTRKGSRGTLHRRRTEGPTLLVFYDPDCEHCHEVMDALQQMALPDSWAVLAVDAETDRARWDETKQLLPAAWEVAFATTDLMGTALYDLSALPTLYLLDASGRVLLKDPTLEALAAAVYGES